MINEQPLARFKPFGTKLLKPIYDDYSFANISDTIHFLLTGEKRGALLPADCFGGSYPQPDKVVAFFIDAFGWQSWQRYRERIAPMRRIAEDGVLTPISALFPSTTAASVTTLNLGVLPAEHAIYEWTIYIPAYGEVVHPLLFSPIGNREREKLTAAGCDPAELSPVHETMHERLAQQGVRSLQFVDHHFMDSGYNTLVSKGAERYPHATLAEGMLQLRQAVENTKEKAYFGLYWPAIDTIAHKYNPDSAFHEAEAIAFWSTFEALLSGMQSPNTIYLFFADHDQVPGKWDETIYINERWPELADILPMSLTGHKIYPNGSPRDLFLHIRQGRREETLTFLREKLKGMAEVLLIDEALALGLFGPSPICGELRRRLGDILILPHEGYGLAWREPGQFQPRMNGRHGGLAPGELISAFAVTDQL